MENSLRKELHEMIDNFSEKKLQEVYEFLQEDELSDEMKIILDREYEEYQKTGNVIAKEDVDKVIHSILSKIMPVYTITFRQRALIEYAESTAWYKERSLQAAQNFVTALENVLKAIANSPYTYRNSYKKFYEVKIKKIPFNIVYFIDESEQRIVVTTIFHQKRNPAKKFR